MTITIELPDELSSRLAASVPEEERVEFAVAAIAEALEAQRQEEAECVAALEEALADMEAGRSISFEESQRQWEEGPIKARLDRLAKAAGRIQGPSVPLEALRRENLYEEQL